MTIARDIAAWISGSETKRGPVELATQAEVDAGIDAERIVTPATLAGADLAFTGGLIEYRIYTGNATWTKPAGCKWIEVWCVGGGGGGAGVQTFGSPEWRIGGAGGGAGQGYNFFDADNFGATVPVVVGAGGAGGASGNNAGSTGGSTTFNGFVGSYFCAGVAGTGGGTAGANAIGTHGNGGDGSVNGGEINDLHGENRGSPGGGGYMAGGEIRGSDGGGAAGGGLNAALGPPAVLTSGGFIGGDPRPYGVGGGGAVIKDSVQARAGNAGDGGFMLIKAYS